MASRNGRGLLPSSLIPTLLQQTGLNTLNSYINKSLGVYDLLSTANEFTFLAPSDDAFTKWSEMNGNKTPAADVLEATIAYHLLNGSYPTVNFADTPIFAPSSLTNTSYSNVTIPPAGQRVELMIGPNGAPEAISSNKTVSSIISKDIVCLGGLIQIIDTILSIPTSIVLLTAEANMSFFIAILARAQFLSLNANGLIDFVNFASFTPNMTFFVPNSAFALAQFTNTSANLSAADLEAVFDYHIVPDFVGYSPDLKNGTVLKTAQGDNITITTNGTDIFVNSARLTSPDYLVVNGVIHVIDSVLDRFNQTIPPQPVNATAPSNATTSAAATATPTHHSSNSKAVAIGVGVAVPIVVLAVLAGLLFWFFRRKKASRAQHELDSSNAAREMSGNPAAKELGANDPAAKELHAPGAGKELHAESVPQELYAPRNPVPAAELE